MIAWLVLCSDMVAAKTYVQKEVFERLSTTKGAGLPASKAGSVSGAAVADGASGADHSDGDRFFDDDGTWLCSANGRCTCANSKGASS